MKVFSGELVLSLQGWEEGGWLRHTEAQMLKRAFLVCRAFLSRRYMLT